MRPLIFWALFLRLYSVFGVITISTTGPVKATIPHTVRWTRDADDLEVLRIFNQRPNQSDKLAPVAVVDTFSQVNGSVDILFDSPSRNRQLVVKDLHDLIIAQTAIFSILNADGSLGESDAKPTTSANPPRNNSSRPSNPLKNPAVLGSVIAAGSVVIIILVMLLFFYWRLRRRRAKEAFLRTQINGYGNESSQMRFSDFQDSPPAEQTPPRPPRINDAEDDLYHFPVPDVPLQSASSGHWSMNSAAGRVHTHQASLTLISPFSPASSVSHNTGRDPSIYESPSQISPATSYNSSASLLHNVPDRFVGFHPPQQSPTLPSPSTSYASPSILLNPPERFGSRDSKRYLAYVEAQRERAEAEADRMQRSRPRREHQENPDEWRSSWQEVADPPPQYPGRSASSL